MTTTQSSCQILKSRPSIRLRQGGSWGGCWFGRSCTFVLSMRSKPIGFSIPTGRSEYLAGGGSSTLSCDFRLFSRFCPRFRGCFFARQPVPYAMATRPAAGSGGSETLRRLAGAIITCFPRFVGIARLSLARFAQRSGAYRLRGGTVRSKKFLVSSIREGPERPEKSEKLGIEDQLQLARLVSVRPGA